MLPHTIEYVEKAYRQSNLWSDRQEWKYHTQGLRAAQARDPKLAEALKISAQLMKTRMDIQDPNRATDANRHFMERKQDLTIQKFEAALDCMNRGTPEVALGWIYAAGCVLAGHLPLLH